MPIQTSEAAPPADAGRAAPLLVRALRSQSVERPPVWFMRQAGRSLPEYREVRRSASLMEITHQPELTAEVTLQPVRRHDVDAAILFSDIVTPLEAIGVGVEIRPGVGPVIEKPVRTRADLARLREFEPESDAPWLAQAVRLTRAELSGKALIGFAGAPFTLASYLVEGGPSKNMARTKAMMRSEPTLWRELLERLAGIAAASLRAQAQAGADAVQIFDSWVGSLSARDYVAHVQPSVAALFEATADLGVPRIYFGLGTGHLLEQIATVGADAVGLDWRIPLSRARRVLPDAIALQGNLDPTACLAGEQALERELRLVLGEAPPRGYVFNLGHGVLPETDPAVLTHLAALVRDRATEVAS